MKLALILMAMQPFGCAGNNEPYFDVRQPWGGIYSHRQATLNGDSPFYVFGLKHHTDWTRK